MFKQVTNDMPTPNKDGPIHNMVAQSEEAVKNGLAEACGFGGYNPFGLPQGPNAFTPAIAGAGTIFTNLRYYLVTNFRQILSQAYVEIGIVQTLVDCPIEDGLRGGVEFKSKQLDEQQILELQNSFERDGDLTVAGDAGKWNRLFGGAGIMILTDQDPETPLDIEAIGPKEKLQFRAVDMWELFYTMQNVEDFNPSNEADSVEFYNYYGETIHKSRVLRLKGLTAPSFIRARLKGWGFSVVEVLVRSINQYLKATALGFEVLDEFKLDVYKIKNLVNTLLSPNGQQKVQQRVQLANWQKNYQNAVVMDSEDDFDHKQLSFAGLAEAMQGIRMQVASDTRFPMIKLFGTPASGLNADDESSIEVYNSMVESQVRGKLKFDILRMAEIKCQKLFQFVPDDLSMTFKPLRELSATDQEAVKTSKYQRLADAKAKGEISVLEYRDAINKGNLFDITLDTKLESLNPDDPEVQDIIEGNNQEDEAEEVEPGKKKMNIKPTPVPTPGQMIHPRSIESLEPWTRFERYLRIINSGQFDKASYRSDGGDDWIEPKRVHFFSAAKAVDKSLWVEAAEASIAALGEQRWQFQVWYYKKMGGKFHE